MDLGPISIPRTYKFFFYLKLFNLRSTNKSPIVPLGWALDRPILETTTIYCAAWGVPLAPEHRVPGAQSGQQDPLPCRPGEHQLWLLLIFHWKTLTTPGFLRSRYGFTLTDFGQVVYFVPLPNSHTLLSLTW